MRGKRMRILFDCRPETMYPLAGQGFSGGSQVYVKAIIEGLTDRGYGVDVIANDLEEDQRRGPNEHWWPPTYFPHRFDVAVMQMHAHPDPEYDAPVAILMTSCVDPWLGPNDAFASSFDAIPVFSEVHKKLLLKTRPSIPADKVIVTGLGVDLLDYTHPYDIPDNGRLIVKVPGRMLYANDPARGLFNTLDVFDLVKKEIPEATLHVAYDFDRQFAMRMWEHSQMAEMLVDCRR